ncbi:serine-rich adhesin for platelets-like isoform X1 [Argopecten irradians]|uniref:serine-rich adhesin for platelets-like isoform X1 n=2 Tax=Argopecten irradians TaxID=31199 RepID=UPI0037247898
MAHYARGYNTPGVQVDWTRGYDTPGIPLDCVRGYELPGIQELPEPFYGAPYHRNQDVTMHGMETPQPNLVTWDYSNRYNAAPNLQYARQFPYEQCDNNIYWISSSSSYDVGKASGWNHSDKPPIPKLKIRPVKSLPETEMQGRRGSSNAYGYPLSRGPFSRRGHHSRPFPSPRPLTRGRGRPVGRPREHHTRGRGRANASRSNLGGRNSDALKTKCVIPNQQNDSESTTHTLRATNIEESDIIKVNPSVPRNIEQVYSRAADGLEDSMSMKENSASLQCETDKLLLENYSKWKDNVNEIESELDSTTNSFDHISKLSRTRISLSELPLSSDKIEVALQKMYPDMFNKQLQVKVKKLESPSSESESPHSCASSLSSITAPPVSCTATINNSETVVSSVDTGSTHSISSNVSVNESVQCTNEIVSPTPSVEDSLKKAKITTVLQFNISKLKSKLKSVKIPGPVTQQSTETQTESFVLESADNQSVSPTPPQIPNESPSLISVSEAPSYNEDSSQLPPPILQPINYVDLDSHDSSFELQPAQNDKDTMDESVDNDTNEETGTKIETVSDDNSLTVVMVETKESLSEAELCAEKETIDLSNDEKQAYAIEMCKENHLIDNLAYEYESTPETTRSEISDVLPESDDKLDKIEVFREQEADDTNCETVDTTTVDTGCDKTMETEPEEEKMSLSLELDLISTDCSSVQSSIQVTKEPTTNSEDVKDNKSVIVQESLVLSNVESANLEDSVPSNVENLGAETYVVENFDFIGIEEHIESITDSTEGSAMDCSKDTNAISYPTVTQSDARNVVAVLVTSNNTPEEDKSSATEGAGKSEVNYDSDASDATVRYSDDEDHHPLKIDIPQDEEEDLRNDEKEVNAANTEADESTDTACSDIPQDILPDCIETDVSEKEEKESDQTQAPLLLSASDVPPPVAGKRKTRGKPKAKISNSISSDKTIKSNDLQVAGVRKKRKYNRKTNNVSKESPITESKEEKLTLTISRSPRKKMKDSHPLDCIDHSKKNVSTTHGNRNQGRSKRTLSGREVQRKRRISASKSRLTVINKRKKRGKKDAGFNFPDIKKIIEGDEDKQPNDDDDLPTILPPKRRRVNLKQENLKMKTTVDDVDRLVQEFPRHNWLENKYKKEEIVDTQDKGTTLESGFNEIPKLDTSVDSGVDTEVSTTTAVGDIPVPQRQMESSQISEKKTKTDVESKSTDEYTPLDLCMKPPIDRQRELSTQEDPRQKSPTHDLHQKSCHRDMGDDKADEGESNNKRLQGNTVQLPCSTPSPATPENVVNASPAPVTTVVTVCTSVNSVSSTSTDSSQAIVGPSTSSVSRASESQFNSVFNRHAQKVTLSPQTKALDKEVYKHLIEYRMIQEREARMAKEREDLIKLKNEKANLLRQLGIQRKSRNLNGGNLGNQPVSEGTLNLSPALSQMKNGKHSKHQAELLGKINNALRNRRRYASPHFPEQGLTDAKCTPAPAHMNVRENIVELSHEIDMCKVEKPAHIDGTGPFMKRKEPLTKPPIEYSTNKPQKFAPPQAHGQTPFQSAGQLIYPLPSFLEHKTKLNRNLHSKMVKGGVVSTNAGSSPSPQSVKGTYVSEQHSKAVFVSDDVRSKVQSGEMQPSSSPQTLSQLVEETVKNTSAGSSCASLETQTIHQSYIPDKNQDTEMVVQRELNEALAKRQRLDDSENATQKSKTHTDQSVTPINCHIDPQLLKSIEENAQLKIKEAERKQQQYAMRVGQQQHPRNRISKMIRNPQQIQSELIKREQKHKQRMFQKEQQQQQRIQQQQFTERVQHHIQQQQQQLQNQTLKNQTRQHQQTHQSQSQENVVVQQNKSQQQHIQSQVTHGAMASSSQGQIPLHMTSSTGQARFMTPYVGQNVNPVIQTQLANRLRVPVNVASQSSNNGLVSTAQSYLASTQNSLLVLQRPPLTTQTVPQSDKGDHTQRVLVGARTVPLATTAGTVVYPNVTGTSDQRSIVPKPSDSSSDNRFPIAIQQANSRGQVPIQLTSAANNRYPVATGPKHINTRLDHPSRDTSLQQQHQRQSAAGAEVVSRMPTSVHEALLNTNTGKIMNYNRMSTTTVQQQGTRYDIPVTYAPNVVIQRDNPPHLQQINGNCKVCGKSAMFLCSSCKQVWYCSQTCQLNHWVSHSHECKS